MIHSSTSYQFSKIVTDILKEPMQYILFSDDNPDSLLLKLENETTYTEKQILTDGTNQVFVYVVPIRYIVNDKRDMDHRLNCRDFVVNLMYQRWCKAHDKIIKSPYVSKTFMLYLEESGVFCSDFIVLSAD